MRTLIALLVMFACGCSSPRQLSDPRPTQWVSREAGVSFRLPTDQGWELIPMPDERSFVIQRKDKTAYVAFFSSRPNGTAKTLDDAFLKQWEKGHSRDRELKQVSAGFFTFKGKRAYKVEDRVNRPGSQRRYTTIVWLDNNRSFEIEATKFDGEPFEDSVIKAFVESMEFLPQSPHES
jgi:hypothetical protein